MAEASSVRYAGTRLYSVSAAARAGRTTIVWAQDTPDAMNVLLAQIDDSGVLLAEPRLLSPSKNQQSQPTVVATSDGYAVMWTEDPDPYRSDVDEWVRFARVDEDGSLVAGPVTLLEGTRSRVTQLLWTGTTFAATYVDVADGWTLNYLALDEQGAPIGEPLLLSADHISSSHLTLRGERVLAAWSQQQGSAGVTDGDIAGTIRVGWFDPLGEPVGKTHRLQAPVEDRRALEPRWLDFGDDVALAWARGSVIYRCAGCYPDDHLEFVILDGESLAPVSNLVTLENRATDGGLRFPRAVRFESRVLLVPSVTYHTHEEGGSATLDCTEAD